MAATTTTSSASPRGTSVPLVLATAIGFSALGWVVGRRSVTPVVDAETAPEVPACAPESVKKEVVRIYEQGRQDCGPERFESRILEGRLRVYEGTESVWTEEQLSTHGPDSPTLRAVMSELSAQIPELESPQVDCNEYPCLVAFSVPADPALREPYDLEEGTIPDGRDVELPMARIHAAVNAVKDSYVSNTNCGGVPGVDMFSCVFTVAKGDERPPRTRTDLRINEMWKAYNESLLEDER